MQERTASRRPRPQGSSPVFVIYRSGAGLVREQFSRASIGAAFMRAEFVERLEGCAVFIQHGYRGKLVRAVS